MPFPPYRIESNRVEALLQRYQARPCAPVGYGTVRDFSDSLQNLPELATINRDLKDLQRPWTLKTILESVPTHSRLLEIGAGDPHVAHWLSSFGHDVWVVDPYDGSGHGPTDFDYYRAHFPHLTFVRRTFEDGLSELQDGSFDCIYSISVLEHIPHAALESVLRGITRYSKPGTPTIHAVDHVLRGRGEEYHRKTLRILGAGFGVPERVLEETLASATDDTETYFLSAESHTMWRGALPYDEFPMRRCISVQFCTRVREKGTR